MFGYFRNPFVTYDLDDADTVSTMVHPDFGLSNDEKYLQQLRYGEIFAIQYPSQDGKYANKISIRLLMSYNKAVEQYSQIKSPCRIVKASIYYKITEEKNGLVPIHSVVNIK